MSVQERTYLNEEKYQKNKKKLTKTAIIIMTIGVIIGLSLIAAGIIRNINFDQKAKAEHEKNVVEKEGLEIRLEELEANLDELISREREMLEMRLEELEPQKEELEKEQRDELRAGGFSDRYYELDKAINEIRKEITDIDTKLWKIKVGWGDLELGEEYDAIKTELAEINTRLDEIDRNLRSGANSDFEKSKSIPFFIFGVFIIISSCMICGYIFLIANGRGIAAFGTQSVMPVAKEGLQEMAPTMREIAKENMKEMGPAMREFAKENMEELGPTAAKYYGQIAGEVARNVRNSAKDEGANIRRCPQCNAQLEEDSVYCEECGKEL